MKIEYINKYQYIFINKNKTQHNVSMSILSKNLT